MYTVLCSGIMMGRHMRRHMCGRAEALARRRCLLTDLACLQEAVHGQDAILLRVVVEGVVTAEQHLMHSNTITCAFGHEQTVCKQQTCTL